MKIFFTVLFSIVLLSSLVPAARAQQLKNWDDPANNCMVDGVPTLKCAEVVYNNVLILASALVLLVLFGMLVYGGVTLVTAFGEPEKIAAAQKIITWAFIGVGLFVAAYLILTIVDSAFLGGEGKVFQLNIPGPYDTPTPAP